VSRRQTTARRSSQAKSGDRGRACEVRLGLRLPSRKVTARETGSLKEARLGDRPRMARPGSLSLYVLVFDAEH